MHDAKLCSATLPGDGFRSQHDSIKWRLDADLQEMGVRVRTGVYGFFVCLLPTAAQAELAGLSLHQLRCGRVLFPTSWSLYLAEVLLPV